MLEYHIERNDDNGQLWDQLSSAVAKHDFKGIENVLRSINTKIPQNQISKEQKQQVQKAESLFEQLKIKEKLKGNYNFIIRITGNFICAN